MDGQCGSSSYIDVENKQRLFDEHPLNSLQLQQSSATQLEE